MGIFMSKTRGNYEGNGKTIHRSSISLFMRRLCSRLFAAIFKGERWEYPLKCSGFVIMLSEKEHFVLLIGALFISYQ